MIGFLDMETGGFSITKNGICEIALVATDYELNVVDTLCVLIKPYTRADDTDELVSYKDDAMAINGLTVEKLIIEGFEVKDVINHIEKFIVKYDINLIIGHNSNSFDLPRFRYILERFGSKTFSKVIDNDDTMIIAKNKLNLPSYKLENLCAHFGIINEKAHSALGDALATLELYKILTA